MHWSFIMRNYLLVAFGLLFSLFILFLFSLPDRNLHITFCDVGQGDGIIISYGTTQMVVDGGPDRSILSCLARSMPFWDRKVELAVVTHPQEDHYAGIIDLVRLYNVEMFLSPDVEGESAGWKVLKSEMEKRKIKQKTVNENDSIRTSSLLFDIYNPIPSFVSKEINDYSIAGMLEFGDFNVLLTGDIIPPLTDQVANRVKDAEVLKVPHHGSKNGLTQALLEASRPQLAVISVGKKNRYGHPSKETLDLLEKAGVKTLRTDLDGTVEVISDGKRWWVREGR